MKYEKYLRAHEIEERIEELKRMQKRLEDEGESFWLRVISYKEDIRLSENMRAVLLGLCIHEKEQLEKEFENL